MALSLSLSTGEIRRIWIPPTAFPRNWTYPSVCCMVHWFDAKGLSAYILSLLCFAGCISMFLVQFRGLTPGPMVHRSSERALGHRYGTTWFPWADCDNFTWVCLRCFVHEFWQGICFFFLCGCVSMNPYDAAIVPGCEIQYLGILNSQQMNPLKSWDNSFKIRSS